MITFDENFFKGEERDGFYVEGEMKRAWAAEMEVLMEVDRICEKHNIRYFADSGTLLGAVRHNGYIPWDDDLDIAMFREDFLKFIQVAKAELKPPMMCLNIYQQEKWIEPFGRVVNGVAGIKLTEEHLERYHGCPYSVGVDIFILDDLPSTEAAFDAAIELAEWPFSIKSLVETKKEHEEHMEEGAEKEEAMLLFNERIEEQLQKLEEFCNVKVDREKDICNQMLKIMDGLYAMAMEEGSDEVANMPFLKKGAYHAVGRKKVWYREAIRLPFENITVPVPIDFDKVLEKAYGPNYLQPVKQWHFHNYPFYKENKRRLQEAQKDVRNIKGKMDRLEKILQNTL